MSTDLVQRELWPGAIVCEGALRPAPLQQLRPRHRKFVRLLVSGLAIEPAARAVGFSHAYANVLMRAPIIRAEKVRLQREVSKAFVAEEASTQRGFYMEQAAREVIDEGLPRAAITLVDNLDAEKASDQIAAAAHILNRSPSGTLSQQKRPDAHMEQNVNVQIIDANLKDAIGRLVDDSRREPLEVEAVEVLP